MIKELLYQHLLQPPPLDAKFSAGWQPVSEKSLRLVPMEWRKWVFHEGSLTSKLIDFSNGHFRVRILSERWQRPSRYEALKLDLNPCLAVRIREVELLCNEEVVVYARTIVPLQLHRQEQALFLGMGTRPLGHFLFREGSIDLERRDIKITTQGDGNSVYGRATPFQFRGSEILVCEFFVNPVLISPKT